MAVEGIKRQQSHVHRLMHKTGHPYGNMACRVNATELGQGAG